MKFEPPNYKELYEKQLELNGKMLEEIESSRKSLRDEFAIAALAGLVGRGMLGTMTPAKEAYDLADAMLSVRKN